MTRHSDKAPNQTKSKTTASNASQNARRHGATARPDAETVTLWLKVILDRDTLTPDDLNPTNAAGQAALQLAKAEARRLAAELATDAAIAPEPAKGSDIALFEEMYAHIEDLTDAGVLDKNGTREAHRHLRRAAKWLAKLTGQETRRLDLLIRYEREAQLARRKAMDTYLNTQSQRQT